MEPKPTLDERPPHLPDTQAPSTITDSKAGKQTWNPPARGTRVGRYEVREPLGSGGMGTVVSAWDPELARPVALKFVGRIHQGGEQEMLLREAQAMAQLKHPGVVPVYDVGTWEGRVFLAMELVDGVNLKDWVEVKPRAPHEVVDLLCQVGSALHAAHGAGIVHRDVKPANVLVDRDGRARITDFGIARVGDDGGETPATLKGPIGDSTAYGRVVGTVGYIAPETLYGELATPAADQFSLAVTACQLFTGVLPFEQRVSSEIAEQLRGNQLVPHELGRVPSRRLRKALRRALDGEPKRRFPSMRAFCEALQPPLPASRTRWAVRIIAAMLIIPAYLALLGYGLTRFAMETVVGGCRARAVSSSLEVWPAARLISVTSRWGERVTGVAEAYVARWRDASLGACFTKDLMQRPTRVAQRQLDCLDAALLGLDERLTALAASGAVASEVDAQLRELSDPRSCVDQWSGESSGVAPWPPR